MIKRKINKTAEAIGSFNNGFWWSTIPQSR